MLGRAPASPLTATHASARLLRLDLGEVEVDACGCFEDDPGFLGVDVVGAGVVDEEPHAVRGEPDVAALAALA